MKTFFSKLFQRTNPDTSQSLNSNTDHGLSIQDGSESATRRQLVHALLGDVLRKNGIPPDWIHCHMLTVSSRSRGQGVYLRLIVKHWDPRFMDYAYAFQNTLITEIERFESNASSWLHGISWQLELGDRCPYQTLPEKTYWQDTITKPDAAVLGTKLASFVPDDLPSTMQAAAPTAAVPRERFQSTMDDETDARNRDLESLFAIRDKALYFQDIPDAGYKKTQSAPLGYEKTKPAPLR